MHTRLKTATALAALAPATGTMVPVPLYAEPGCQGRTLTAERPLGNFTR